MPCQIPYRDDSAQILLWKIASCIAEGGGGGVAGVSSFNGRTGAVILSLADVAAVGDGRYVLKSGDSMTGALSIDNGSQVASTPYLSLSQTWNNAAVTFTGLFSNITNTASNTDSNLFNFQSDGIDRFRFAVGGQLYAIRQDASNSGQTFFLRKRGNAGGATNAVAADSTIGTISFSAWDGTAFATGSQIQGLAAEAWTNVAHGSRLTFYTTPIGSTTDQITLLLSNSGQTQLRDGTAPLPALAFQSDPDTGMYRTGADSVGLSTGGTLRTTTNTTDLILATAFRLAMASGANTRAGNATLVAGTVTVANTSVTANTIVMLTRKTSGGTLGTAITYTVIAATSFTINSDSALDTSTFSYVLIENP